MSRKTYFSFHEINYLHIIFKVLKEIKQYKKKGYKFMQMNIVIAWSADNED